MDQVQFLQEIGRGSFAKVYKVLYENKIYAMKVIDLEKQKGPINDEIHILQQLNHENVVKYTKVFLENSQLFILMEYCGCSLLDIINYTLLSDDQAFFIIQSIISALQYLHSQNIIHNDIKPENILFCNSQVKISDFGISKQSISLYKYEGTPHYSAPEQYLNQATPLSDYWPLGVIYVQMVTKKVLQSQISNLNELFVQKEHILQYVKQLNLTRKGLDFCDKVFRRRAGPEQLLKCKGFKIQDQNKIYEQIAQLYKEISKQKEFYSPATSFRSFTYPVNQQDQFEWSFSSESDASLGYFSQRLKNVLTEQNIEIGKFNEEQAKQVIISLQGLSIDYNEFTQEQIEVLRLLE
ncbi:Kinase [Spironucleus salmonicida]|uniref:non-specific serine/threonine protein kinase n=1 Tax=Spironucleus salmonicida TaxID=348837 RepID=V6LMT8_9EUKA|nr:Kinase [Spironucleus salmonicida]|eukprot:EST42034.1 Kinase [Spironucleus salmonicida]